ncbi:YkvA family protein [Nocardiopsis sp. RSe5-2]|uniref:YkvA family protein n=1 Tax=Nocardiopsis endophytica TaxID=3018445 RepID=A0ABT4UC70_9ACTN|nr:YkvA family protein [Nocardiopsis endophytica]MDA2814578.1 YkvA family protein [Nocardiopsis endophytica]
MRRSNRAAAGAAAWQVVHEGIEPGKPTLWARAGAVPRMLGARITGRYTGMPVSRVLMFVAALVYVVSPVDLVPELFIPLFGLADDAFVAVWLAAGLMGETERFLDWERQEGREYVQGRVVG